MKTLSVDTETNGEDVRDGRGFSMGISIAGRVSGEIFRYYFPFRHIVGGNLDKRVLALVKEVIEDAEVIFFHNAKFDLVSLSTLGIVYRNKFYDTMLMCHLLNENRPFAKNLDGCADWYLEGGVKAELRHVDLEIKRAKRANNFAVMATLEARREIIQSKMGTYHKDVSEEFKKYIEKFGWANIPPQMMFPYAAQDAKLTYELGEKLWPMFKEEGLLDYWPYKETFTHVLIAMEGAGVKIDVNVCKQEAEKGEVRMAEIVRELGGLNPASTTDLRILLIDKLNLPVLKTTPAGKPSFDKTVMPEYDEMLEANGDPTAQLILEFRGWQKTVSSNYRPYLELLSPDGRLRPNYKMHGTRTGRLSCEKPNLQQIPKTSDKPWNGKLKAAFIPEDGYVLYEADYSQLELRLTAAYSGEQSLIETFNDGRDIFDEMSERLGMVRQDCKTFVYSTQYGAGVRRIKNALGITESKAKTIRSNYHSTYPAIKAFSDATQARAKSRGKVQLWSGRFRHFFDPEGESHKAMNSLMQGGGADVVERQMIRLYNQVAKSSNDECRMLLQVHDSVVFEIKKGTEMKYLPMIKSIMEDVDALAVGLVPGDEFGVKFNVDIHVWGTDNSWRDGQLYNKKGEVVYA